MSFFYSVLYVQDTTEGDPRTFLDPNKLDEEGTTSIRGTQYSEDGTYFAYGLSSAGSDWVTIKVCYCLTNHNFFYADFRFNI